jgi:hypothetical protein
VSEEVEQRRGYYKLSMSAQSMQSILPINGEFQIDSVVWDATRRVIEINISGADLPPQRFAYDAIMNINLELQIQKAEA